MTEGKNVRKQGRSIEVWGAFERCLAPIRIGLTATPSKHKKHGLVCEGFLGKVIGQLTIQEGMEKGLAEGMERGMTQRSFEIARKMLANGMDTATVMEITGLSEEQLNLQEEEM